MFQLDIENPFEESIENFRFESLFDFEMIKLKFKKTFYGDGGRDTDRTKMKMEELDIETKDWMNTYLKMQNGLIEFTIPKNGKYQIIQQSRSSNRDIDSNCQGPAMGVTLEFKIDLKKVNIFIDYVEQLINIC